MGAFIVRQPNGKLARFSTVSDCCTHYNMTEQEYINYCCKRAEEEAKDIIERHLYPFDDIIDRFMPNNQTYEEFIEQLKEMGASKEQIQYAYENWEQFKKDTGE